MRGLFVVIVPVLLLGSVIAKPWTAHSIGQLEAIDAPTEWAPFDADWEKATPKSGVIVSGRFYRGSDGSTREEATVANQTGQRISLVNVGSETYFERSVQGVWCRHPMKLPPKGYRPPRMRTSRTGLSRLSQTTEGFEVYEVDDISKVTQVIAPRLNFFPLVLRNKESGTVQRYFNIQVGAQDEALFSPPPGIPVAWHPRYRGGIIHVEPGERPLKLADLDRHK